jgi:signal transduction histidine kinase
MGQSIESGTRNAKYRLRRYADYCEHRYIVVSSLPASSGLGPAVKVRLRSASAAWAAGVVGAVAIGCYYLIPAHAQDVLYVVIGLASVAAVEWGALRNLESGRHRLAWHLFAAGLLLQVAGDFTSGYWEIFRNAQPPLPSIADGFYLAGYPLLVAGAFAIPRRSSPLLAGTALLDTLVVFLAVLLFQWVYFVDVPDVSGLHSLGARLVATAYPVMDAVLLVAVGQLMVPSVLRTRAYRLLILSIALWVVADEVYALTSTSYNGGWLDALWLASYVCWGCAALDRSVAELEDAPRDPLARLTPVRLTLLAAALIAAPVLIVARRAAHDSVPVSVGVIAGLIALGAMGRFVGLIRTVDRARLAEQEVRREAEVAERLLRFQNDRLRELDRLKDEFVSAVSHELRTPLTSISGYAELLRLDEKNPERRRYLDIVERNAERLISLVSDVLFAARLQDGRLQLIVEPVDLQQLIVHAADAARPRAASTGVELVVRADEPLGVEGEPERLGQLLDNLVSNAIKFTPDGGRVSITGARDGDLVRVEVSDTGIGIAPEESERLFERFFRSQVALERQIQGTGLGLYISKAIVEAHGGRIGVSSTQGEGTTFMVELPAAS